MDARRVQAWIAVVAGLALTGVLLVAGSAMAETPPDATVSQDVGAAAAWSSGWVFVPPGTSQTFTHNLGGNPGNYGVDLMFWDNDWGYNRAYYGGYENNGTWLGANWQNLTPNTIEVNRQPDDTTADWVRVTVWPLPTPHDYDSGWTPINPGQTLHFTHNVGGPLADLTVGLWFSGTARGINQYAYGGLDDDLLNDSLGASWEKLTINTVDAYRWWDDSNAEQVRVMVGRTDPPDFDSGYQNIAAGGAHTITHGLRWYPGMLRVRGDCNDDTYGAGINGVVLGGNHRATGMGSYEEGAYIRNLTAMSITVVRGVDDWHCSQGRVRIWKWAAYVYLPAVQKQ